MSDLPTVWQPAALSEGTDLIPTSANPIVESPVPLIEDDEIDPEDIRLPQLQVLQGTSKVVQAGEVEGAVPGRLYFSGNDLVIKPPARLLVIHTFTSNALFVRDDPAYAGLENCLSRDGVTGTVYGDCASCGKCTEWTDNRPPLGTQSRNLVVWIGEGLAILRIPLTNKWAGRAWRDFATRKAMTRRNWFMHPTLVFVDRHTNDKDQPYSVARPRWDEKIIVPEAIQKQCYAWYRQVSEALEHGKLSGEDEHETTAQGEKRERTSEGGSQESAADDGIPF